MKIDDAGNKSCLAKTDGCGTGYFINDHQMCQKCHTDCASCDGKGPDD